MQKNRILKWLRINYAVSFVSALLVMVAFESGYLRRGLLSQLLTESDAYTVQVVAVMLTVALVPFAIKSFSRNLKKAKGVSNNEFLRLYSKNTLRRIFLLFIAVVVNEFVYYGFGYEGALYCAIIGYGALVYSFPTKHVLENYIQELNN